MKTTLNHLWPKRLKKNTRTGTTLVAAIALILATLFINSCKKPTEGIELTVDESTLTKAPVLVHFANANATSGNQPQDFNVKITGKDAAYVQTDGGATTNFKASHGFLPLSLTAAAAPSPGSPVTFNISAEVPGFAPVVHTVTITKDTATIVDVAMIEYNSPPQGAAVLVTSKPLSDGVSSGTVLNVSAGAGMVETAQIQIQPGTQMLDINGSPISASQLKANIVNYSATSTTSYGAFPGGFHPSNVVDLQGRQVNGGYPINFVSAGLLSINMEAGSKQVRRFSKPLQVSMKLDPNTTNLTTGQNIKAGDTVPLWSLNEDTGQWTKEGIVTIQSEGGSLVANFETSHLCCFNLDWSWTIAGMPFGTCFTPLTVRIHCGAGNSGVFDVTIVTPNNQYLAGAHGVYVRDGEVVVFPSVPNIAQCKVVISSFNLYLNPRLPILAQTGLFNPCTQGSVDLNFGLPQSPGLINVNFNVTGRCTNRNVRLQPSGWFYLYNEGAAVLRMQPWTCVYISNGVIKYASGAGVTGRNGRYSIQLFNGNRYYMYAYNNYFWYQSSIFTMEPRDFDFPSIVGITGTARYDAASNTLNVVASFNIKCR